MVSFLEIAYQAEVSRYEDPEFEEIAKKNCNECFQTRGKVIEELRTMIRDKGECIPRRMDDAYLLRFLRCRKFIPALAHRLLVRYEEFRRKNAYLYDCDGFALNKVKNIYGTCLPESVENGRIVIMRLGQWQSDIITIEDMIRCGLFIDEIGVQQPKLQVLGITIIIDLNGMGIQQLSKFTPSLAGQVLGLMGISFPILIHGLHIINYGWALTPAFGLYKRLVPSAYLDKVQFHGSDLSSLHRHIDPQFLPKDLGGHCKYYIPCEDWISKIYKYKDDFLVQELRDLGFYVRDDSDGRLQLKCDKAPLVRSL